MIAATIAPKQPGKLQLVAEYPRTALLEPSREPKVIHVRMGEHYLPNSFRWAVLYAPAASGPAGFYFTCAGLATSYTS